MQRWRERVIGNHCQFIAGPPFMHLHRMDGVTLAEMKKVVANGPIMIYRER